jgi:hypothetical protein
MTVAKIMRNQRWWQRLLKKADRHRYPTSRANGG